MDEIAQAARRKRRPLNVLMTIRGRPDLDDAAAKHEIAKQVGHLGQDLKRRGQEHVGITTYEKAPHLHAHHLLHVCPENDDVIARRVDGEIIHACRADAKAVGYITKQRDWLGPDYESVIRKQGMRWEKSGGAVPGTRWTVTAAARSLMDAERVRDTGAPAEVSVARGRPIFIKDAAAEVRMEPVEPVQLPLFQDLPARLPPFSTGGEVRELRIVTGLTQERLARPLGIRDRSHVANIERGHDRLSPQRRRLLQYLLETERLAA